MNKKYINPEIEIIYFDENSIVTASIAVGDTTLPGEEIIDGSDIFI